MNICKSCGAEMIFDIASQKLRCPFCDRKKDPGRIKDLGKTAEEKKITEMDVIRYTCPQCGGSIYSTKQSINGFCSYCGSNVIIESQMAKMEYPRYVAPFRIDKEACKKYYLKHVKKAFFAPKEMKDPGHLDQFRGIYMTYWGYDVKVEGFIYLDGSKRIKVGNNVMTERYKCMGWLDAMYDNIFFDASSSFEDHFSEQIAPFDYNGLQEFTPAYLSGFYADLPDLEDDVYEENALYIAKEKAYKSTRLKKYFPGVKFDEQQKDKFDTELDLKCNWSYTTFFPIWFLAYRNRDRVAYAVVNGQTGRVACDLPIDPAKFMITGMLLAAVIFVMLYFMPPARPVVLLLAGEFFSLISVLLLAYMIKKVYIRKEKVYDKGFLSKTSQLNYKYQLKTESDRRLEKAKRNGLIPLIVAGVLAGIPIIFYLFSEAAGGFLFLATLILGIVTEVVVIKVTEFIIDVDPNGKIKLLFGIWMTFIWSVYCIYLILKKEATADDINVAVFLQMSGTLIAQLMALEQYNLLSTRPLPQLNRKGGNTNA